MTALCPFFVSPEGVRQLDDSHREAIDSASILTYLEVKKQTLAECVGLGPVWKSLHTLHPFLEIPLI